MTDISAAESVARPFVCGRYRLDRRRPWVMGILNITDDSFSDGGRFLARDAALRQAERLLGEGADLLDIGGESSRPGAAPLSLDEELARVMPVIEALRDCGKPLSVDTYKPAVMRAVLSAGADLINDIWGLRQPGALDAVANHTCGLCIMHMQRDPQTMQAAPFYDDVVGEVKNFLVERVAACDAAGIARDRICLDPGFGFGKNLAHNLALLARLPDVAADGLPVLAGMSRKSMLGELTGRTAPSERLSASIAAALCAAERGALILRVHDVAATVDALKVWQAVHEAANGWRMDELSVSQRKQ